MWGLSINYSNAQTKPSGCGTGTHFITGPRGFLSDSETRNRQRGGDPTASLPSITQSQALRSLPAHSVCELYRIQRPPHNGERVCRMHAGRDLDTSGLQSGTPRKLVFYTLSCYCVPQQARGLHQSPGLQVALAQGLAAARFSGGRGSSGGIVQLRVVKAVLEIQDIVDVSAVAQEEQT